MAKIGDQLRKRAEHEGLTLEAFRKKYGFPNTSFYRLLRGELPSTVAARTSLGEKVAATGIRSVPRELRAAS